MSTQQQANLRFLETVTELHERLQQANADSPFVKRLEQFIQKLRQQIGD